MAQPLVSFTSYEDIDATRGESITIWLDIIPNAPGDIQVKFSLDGSQCYFEENDSETMELDAENLGAYVEKSYEFSMTVNSSDVSGDIVTALNAEVTNDNDETSDTNSRNLNLT
ncbi:MAG: hypothetical protein MI975_19670 [Cytophagales bacterium]|nr:hypothetical protein [Cytophagales bacterium]